MGAGGQSAFHAMVGERVKEARNSQGMKQEQLAEFMGFKDRQTLSNIERGKRKVSTEDLLMLMRKLNKPIEYFTDPYLMAGNNTFSWRTSSREISTGSYEDTVRNTILAYRRFSAQLKKKFNPVVPIIRITERSSFEEAWEAGEVIAEKLNLGRVPAKKTSDALRKLSITLLYVDAPDGISGVACHTADFNAILINRNESESRRNLSIAHELFHILTWDEMKPETIDVIHDNKEQTPRIELLANNFAAGLLVPSKYLEPLWRKYKREQTEDIHEWLKITAQSFHVSGEALRWRLVNLGWLTKGDSNSIDTDKLRTASLAGGCDGEKPKLYSRVFAERIRDVIANGFVSVRKVASLLGCYVEDLNDLFLDYDLESPMDI